MIKTVIPRRGIRDELLAVFTLAVLFARVALGRLGEIFGPLVVLETFQDEANAVARANNTVFGLSASVWTNRGDASWRLARALRNGTVWINDHNRLFAEAETGGYRRSGLGRLHGFDGLLDFCELKHVYQNVGVVGH